MENKLQPHQERVVVERDALLEKFNKLGNFFSTDLFSKLCVDEQVRLKLQYNYMSNYLIVLNERIAAFQEL